jgi:hypothetical protein
LRLDPFALVLLCGLWLLPFLSPGVRGEPKTDNRQIRVNPVPD